MRVVKLCADSYWEGTMLVDQDTQFCCQKVAAFQSLFFDTPSVYSGMFNKSESSKYPGLMFWFRNMTTPLSRVCMCSGACYSHHDSRGDLMKRFDLPILWNYPNLGLLVSRLQPPCESHPFQMVIHLRSPVRQPARSSAGSGVS